jgi:hypothetical protein
MWKFQNNFFHLTFIENSYAHVMKFLKRMASSQLNSCLSSVTLSMNDSYAEALTIHGIRTNLKWKLALLTWESDCRFLRCKLQFLIGMYSSKRGYMKLGHTYLKADSQHKNTQINNFRTEFVSWYQEYSQHFLLYKMSFDNIYYITQSSGAFSVMKFVSTLKLPKRNIWRSL